MRYTRLALCLLSSGIALWCLPRLWRFSLGPETRPLDPLPFLPLIGPPFFGAFFRPSPRQPEHLQAPFDFDSHVP